MIPLTDEERLRSVRCVNEWVVVSWPFTARDCFRFALDPNHRFNEPVEFPDVFTLGWLNHECSRHGERHCWCVETVIDESFGDIVNGDPGFGSQRAEVQDALVRN